MASPQLENGYTRIANEILEALARNRIPGEPRQVFDVILRKTYGFHKKVDAISLSQFVLATGINRPNIIRAIKQLITMNLIIKYDTGITCKYSINKDFISWRPLSKKITALKVSKNSEGGIIFDNEGVSKKITGSIIFDNEVVSSLIHTKERKKGLQKKERKGKPETATSSLKDSFNVFYTAYPKHQGKEAALKAWTKLNPDDPLLRTILQAIVIAKETDSWKKDNGKYIPLPATWLNGKRWEDELNAGEAQLPVPEPLSKDGVLEWHQYSDSIMDFHCNCIQPGKEHIVARFIKNAEYPYYKENPRTVEQWERFILELPS